MALISFDSSAASVAVGTAQPARTLERHLRGGLSKGSCIRQVGGPRSGGALLRKHASVGACLDLDLLLPVADTGEVERFMPADEE